MSQNVTNFANGFQVDGVPTMGMNGLPLTTGTVFFVDYVNGSDGNVGSASFPMKTVYRAYASCVSGRGDVVAIVSNGLSTGTQRLSLANAVAVDSTVTAGTLVWAKNNTHLVGLAAVTQNARARFAPPTGTYTVTTFGSGNFVTVSGSGCIFANFSLFQGFSTGGNSQICWTDSGNYNSYHNVSFGGAADAGSAQSTSSRSFLKNGGDECSFYGCTFGVDTVTKTVANFSLELANGGGLGTARNRFYNCFFPLFTSSATTAIIKVAASSQIDRWTTFKNCTFENAILSTGTAATGVALIGASAGGGLLFQDCTTVGFTDYGYDATSKAQIYVGGSVPTGNSSGIAVVNT